MTVKINIWMKIQVPTKKSTISCIGDHLEPALISHPGLIFLLMVEDIQTLSSRRVLVPFSAATCRVLLVMGLKKLNS